jgi:hypothetical protein
VPVAAARVGGRHDPPLWRGAVSRASTVRRVPAGIIASTTVSTAPTLTQAPSRLQCRCRWLPVARQAGVSGARDRLVTTTDHQTGHYGEQSVCEARVSSAFGLG